MNSLLHSIPFLYSGIFMALIAHGLIGISLVWDKVLLRQPETKNLVSYVFWLGAISILGLALIPFGMHRCSVRIAVLAFVTGMLHLVAVYFYYAALKAGEASQTLAVMGGFSPVATALIGIPLLKKQLGGYSLIAFFLLTAGGFIMFFAERVPLRKMLFRVLAASVAFGFVNVFEKVVYDNTNFVTGYVYFTFGTFIGAMAMLLLPDWRQQIGRESDDAEPRSRFWYFVNRFISGIGSFLIFYSISLTNPALVDAITAVRYVIIFLGAYLLTRLKPVWLHENFAGRVLAGKVVATLMVVAGLTILGMAGNGEGGSPSTWLRMKPYYLGERTSINYLTDIAARPQLTATTSAPHKRPASPPPTSASALSLSIRTWQVRFQAGTRSLLREQRN